MRKNVRGSVAREGKYTRPARYHVTYHVHVAELKETARLPPLPTHPPRLYELWRIEKPFRNDYAMYCKAVVNR